MMIMTISRDNVSPRPPRPSPARPASEPATSVSTLQKTTVESPHVRSEEFSVFYHSNEAVKKMTINIPRGEITAIIGPSGCGKSTFLRAINRMNDLIPGCRTGGRLLLDEENIHESRVDITALRRRVGMVFQKPNPFPKTVFDNVAFGPRIHRNLRRSEVADLVEQSLRRAALWDEVKDRLAENALGLSGGQQQRLCIARALAVEPELLLMDEPTSALDPIATDRIEDLMNELRSEYTVIIVTHNMQQAARVSDRTAFMYMGELIEFGRTKDLFTHPRHPRTQDYITGRFG